MAQMVESWTQGDPKTTTRFGFGVKDLNSENTSQDSEIKVRVLKFKSKFES